MQDSSLAGRILEHEARALLTRLALVKPFALHETMVLAASVPVPAQAAIERYLASGRRQLARMVHDFIRWIRGPEARQVPPHRLQRKFTLLRLRFNAVLTQFDIFSAVMTQRSENETGVWLAGLDVASSEALALPGGFYETPPIVCYLDRGHGAAIRRVRTRLPGGGSNPVAVIRVPRERMVGSGIASSLVHEVGHQAAALLGLVQSVRPVLHGLQSSPGPQRIAWQLWERWISEILADFWSVARVGVSSTMGLIGVMSLPRIFVFRIDTEDPHPTPWIRVMLSCAMGRALYPHPQWDTLARLWTSFYPLDKVDAATLQTFQALLETMPAFVNLLITHRPSRLRGKALSEALGVRERQPARLNALYESWRLAPSAMRATPPTLAFAVIGQARADGKLEPEQESTLVAGLLTHWALRSAIDTSELCAASTRSALATAEKTVLN